MSDFKITPAGSNTDFSIVQAGDNIEQPITRDYREGEDRTTASIASKPVTWESVVESANHSLIANAGAITAIKAAAIGASFIPGVNVGAATLAVASTFATDAYALGSKAMMRSNPAEFWVDYYKTINEASQQDKAFLAGITQGSSMVTGSAVDERLTRANPALSSGAYVAGNGVGLIAREILTSITAGKALRSLGLLGVTAEGASTAGFITSSALINSVNKYQDERGFGEDHLHALKSSMALGVASAATGALFLGVLPRMFNLAGGLVEPMLGSAIKNPAGVAAITMAGKSATSAVEWGGWGVAHDFVEKGIMGEDFELNGEEAAMWGSVGATIGLIVGSKGVYKAVKGMRAKLERPIPISPKESMLLLEYKGVESKVKGYGKNVNKLIVKEEENFLTRTMKNIAEEKTRPKLKPEVVKNNRPLLQIEDKSIDSIYQIEMFYEGLKDIEGNIIKGLDSPSATKKIFKKGFIDAAEATANDIARVLKNAGKNEKEAIAEAKRLYRRLYDDALKYNTEHGNALYKINLKNKQNNMTYTLDLRLKNVEDHIRMHEEMMHAPFEARPEYVSWMKGEQYTSVAPDKAMSYSHIRRKNRVSNRYQTIEELDKISSSKGLDDRATAKIAEEYSQAMSSVDENRTIDIITDEVGNISYREVEVFTNNDYMTNYRKASEQLAKAVGPYKGKKNPAQNAYSKYKEIEEVRSSLLDRINTKIHNGDTNDIAQLQENFAKLDKMARKAQGEVEYQLHKKMVESGDLPQGFVDDMGISYDHIQKLDTVGEIKKSYKDWSKELKETYNTGEQAEMYNLISDEAEKFLKHKTKNKAAGRYHKAKEYLEKTKRMHREDLANGINTYASDHALDTAYKTFEGAKREVIQEIVRTADLSKYKLDATDSMSGLKYLESETLLNRYYDFRDNMSEAIIAFGRDSAKGKGNTGKNFREFADKAKWDTKHVNYIEELLTKESQMHSAAVNATAASATTQASRNRAWLSPTHLGKIVSGYATTGEQKSLFMAYLPSITGGSIIADKAVVSAFFKENGGKNINTFKKMTAAINLFKKRNPDLIKKGIENVSAEIGTDAMSQYSKSMTDLKNANITKFKKMVK